MNRARPEYDMKAMGCKIKYYRKLRNLTVEDVRTYMKSVELMPKRRPFGEICLLEATNVLIERHLKNNIIDYIICA